MVAFTATWAAAIDWIFVEETFTGHTFTVDQGFANNATEPPSAPRQRGTEISPTRNLQAPESITGLRHFNSKEKSPNDLLLLGAQKPSLEKVKMALERGADIETRHKNKYRTALHIAAAKPAKNVIAHLLRYGANPLAKDEQGLTPRDIVLACKTTRCREALRNSIATMLGRHEEIWLLRNIEREEVNEQISPIQPEFSLEETEIDSAQNNALLASSLEPLDPLPFDLGPDLLIELTADEEQETNPYQGAADPDLSLEGLEQLLLSFGSDEEINLITEETSPPEDTQAEENLSQQAQLLHQAVRVQDLRTVYRMLQGPQIEYYINLRDDYGNTALQVALLNNDFNIAKLLVQYGAIAGVQDCDNFLLLEVLKELNLISPQRLTAYNRNTEDQDSINPNRQNAFSQSRIDQESSTLEKRKKLNCLLFREISYGNLGNVKNILEEGADLEARSSVKGRTPLLAALKAGKKNMIEYFFSLGADPLATDNQGNTAEKLLLSSKKLGEETLEEIKKRLKEAQKAARKRLNAAAVTQYTQSETLHLDLTEEEKLRLDNPPDAHFEGENTPPLATLRLHISPEEAERLAPEGQEPSRKRRRGHDSEVIDITDDEDHYEGLVSFPCRASNQGERNADEGDDGSDDAPQGGSRILQHTFNSSFVQAAINFARNAVTYVTTAALCQKQKHER